MTYIPLVKMINHMIYSTLYFHSEIMIYMYLLLFYRTINPYLHGFHPHHKVFILKKKLYQSVYYIYIVQLRIAMCVGATVVD